ncbi:recombinase family protein [Brevibacterium sp. UMB1308A]|nr:recombinase family protein [Brevibacterium sp. UMB1308A]MDK8345226.1 recombinase family protein [Brevibacterium sp. UMB1308B]MDK8713911.1 recombinase family protein [Brevibacterium sp. UMB1308A]
MARTVTAIPATRRLHTGTPLGQTTVRKVAGYARVSTDHEDPVTSYEAQVDYYTRYVSSHAGWKLAGIYTDEGITGNHKPIITPAVWNFVQAELAALRHRPTLLPATHLLRQNPVWTMRTLVRLENLAFRHQIRKTNLAVQQQIRRQYQMRNPEPDRSTN